MLFSGSEPAPDAASLDKIIDKTFSYLYKKHKEWTGKYSWNKMS